MNDDYESLLIQKYEKNLNSFKINMPDIYNQLILKQNNSYSLEIKNKNLNIVKDDNRIYPYDDPKEYTNILLESYKQRDKLNLIDYGIDVNTEDISLYNFGVQTLQYKYQKEISDNYFDLFDKYPDCSQLNPYHKDRYCMMIFGIGLGYHIPELINEYNIQKLILIDTSIEMLRASLYTLDWEELFLYFKSDDSRTIDIIIADNSKKIKHEILVYFIFKYPIAYYNLAQFMLYNNDVFSKSISELTHILKDSVGNNFGFFDDEKWSLQHTIHNINSKIPILTNRSFSFDKDVKVFLVGNGPSLDKYIHIIKENKDKAIIIACGTAFGSLYKYGIIADFLIENERTIDTYDAICLYAPMDVLKTVKFIGMNTLHPRVFSLFDKSFMFLKYFDAGASFLKLNDKYPELKYANPTVTNAAMRISIFLGFKDICLFGMDFGYASVNNHHSKNSILHMDKSSRFYASEYQNELRVTNVYGEKIYTNNIYNLSRKNIESIIDIAVKEDNINFYNFSDGAMIHNTKVSNEDYIFLKQSKNILTIEHKKIIETITSQYSVYTEDIIIDKTNILKKIDAVKEVFYTAKKENISAYEYLKTTDKIWNIFKREFPNKSTFHIMLKGTLISLMMKTYVFVSFQAQDEKTSKFINNSIDSTINFLNDAKLTINNIDKYIDKPFRGLSLDHPNF